MTTYGTDERYRIYAVENRQPVLRATAPNAGGLGLAIVTLSEERLAAGLTPETYGVLDGATEPGRWLCSPSWGQQQRAVVEPEYVFVYGVLLGYGEENAVVHGRRLAFRNRYTTALEEEGADIWGQLVPASPSVLEDFDRVEGVQHDFYRRVMCHAERADGTEVNAWIYEMLPPHVWQQGKPEPGYVAIIRNWYVRLGLPESALDAALAETRSD